MATLIERLISGTRRKEELAGQTFGGLVVTLADGANADEGEVEKILDASKRTPDELLQAVAVLKRRREVASVLAQCNAKANEAAEHRQQRDALVVEARKSAAEFKRRIVLADQQASASEAFVFSHESAARRELEATASDRIKSRMAEIAEERGQLAKKRKAEAERRSEVSEVLAHNERILARNAEHGFKLDPVDKKNEATQRQRVELAQRIIAECDAALLELDAEQSKLNAEILQP